MKKYKKVEIYMLISSALLLTFTFCVFGPIQLFIGNITEFWFSIGEVVLPSIIAFIAMFSILVAIGMLLRGKVREWFTCLVFGLALALYIQGNFILTDYGVLDGRTIDWVSYKSEAIINTIVWIVCIISPFILRYLKKTKLSIVLISISCGILLVQIITLGTLVLTTNFASPSKNDFYLSYEGIHEVSEQENVVIFILDAFGVEYLREIIELEPEFTEPLDGFTNYNNATGSYQSTTGALPYLLTSQFYENDQKFKDYLDEAYANTDYYNELKSEGFDIGIYTESLFLPVEFANQYVSNNVSESVEVSSSYELGKTMLQFTAFTHFPHIAKPLVWLDTGIYDKLKTSSTGKKPFKATDDFDFYNPLKEDGLSLNNSNKSYRFIHLNGAHGPYILGEDVTVDPEATYYTQAKASLNMVYKYIEELKQLNIYDNTMIIITTDHGVNSGIITSPLLVVKLFDQRGILKQSQAPVAHGDLQATVMDALGLNTSEKYGIPLQDISETSQRTRRYLRYSFDDPYGEYLPKMVEYTVSPDNNDPTSYIKTGKIFYPGGETVDTDYILGETIDLTAQDDRKYFISGISGTSTGGTWSLGKTSTMKLNFKPVKDDLVAQIDLSSILLDEQNVRIFVESQEEGIVELFNELVTESFSFDIPYELVKDGNLLLEFEYENATSPLTVGMNDDPRVLAIAFTKITITEAGIIDRIDPLLYILDEPIDFTGEGEGSKYFTSGLSGAEGTHIWSLGKTSEMKLNFEPTKNDLVAQIDLRYVLLDEQNVRVTGTSKDGNSIELFNEVVTGGFSFAIPNELVKDGSLALNFEYENAATPEGGERMLAIAFSKITITEAGIIDRIDPLLYILDEPIDFTGEGEGSKYFTSGLSGAEGTHIWSLGKTSEMKLNFEPIKNDLVAQIDLRYVLLDEQNVRVTGTSKDGNSIELFNEVVTGGFSFAIPNELIRDGSLALHFEYENAATPEGGERMLAIAFSKITISEKEQ